MWFASSSSSYVSGSGSYSGSSINVDPNIQNRGTLAERVGMVVTAAFSYLFQGVGFCYRALRDWVLAPIKNYILSPICTLISKIFNLVVAGAKTFHRWVISPIIDYILKPIWNAVSTVFDLIKRGIVATAKAINNWVISPIVDYVLKPIWNVVVKACNVVKKCIVATAKAINNWVISPVIDYVLKPIWNVVSKVFNLVKSGVVSVAKAINNWVISPVIDYILKPIWKVVSKVFMEIIKVPYNWVLKPMFNSLGDCAYGIYRRAVLGKEYNTEDLQRILNKSLVKLHINGSLNTKEEITPLLDSLKAVAVTDDTKKARFKAINSALGLYLNKFNEQVIAQKWIEKTCVNDTLRSAAYHLGVNVSNLQ